MGLSLQAKGFDKNINIGYGGFSLVRKEIALAYSEKHGKLYEQMLKNIRQSLSDNFINEWNDGCNDDLDILLWHSDCDGKLTPKECRKIYRVLEHLDVKFDVEQIYYKDFFKDLKEILMHCFKRRVNLYFY